MNYQSCPTVANASFSGMAVSRKLHVVGNDNPKLLVQTPSGLQQMCCCLVQCSAHLLMDVVAHVDKTMCHELWNASCILNPQQCDS